MLFSSLTFLLYFLPVFFGAYFLLPARWQNGFLLLGSLVFYGFAEPVYILLILLESLIGYLAGIWMEKSRNSKVILAGAVLLYAGVFIYFKYAGFLLENVSLLFGLKTPVWNVLLPLGISFYTFQIISYNVDVYRKTVPVQRSFVRFAAYVCMFPQLIAGPIVRYSTIDAQLENRITNAAQIREGLLRFVCGLSKKVLLANQLFAFCEAFRTAGDPSVLYCWLNALGITLYTYFDFSGYSDMAIGLGKVMGFSFPENFSHPFLTRSITDFWRRWHISLTTWFKDYVYIPLGGSRVSPARHLFNLFVVWMFTGLWHGADWTFVVWGLTFFFILVFEKFVLRTTRISYLYVWIILLFTFLLFNDPSLGQFWQDFKNMVGWGGLPIVSDRTWYALRSNAVLLIVSLAGSGPWVLTWWNKWTQNGAGAWIKDIAAACALLLCLAYIVGGSFNPFLYFRF